MSSTAQHHDLIVIGSGIYGIQAARIYLELHPNHNVVILEADSAPGGVWSRNRMYDAFWTQSPLDSWEFSDQPLTGVEKKDAFHMYFEARHFTRYLEEYLEGHIYGGKTLMERILFGARVERLWKEEEQWHARTSNGGEHVARKVIDATGKSSIPNIPEIPGAESFKGKMLHHKDFGRSEVARTCKRVVVIVGAKSAADVAYALGKAGLEVHWVIRKTGNGPAAYFPPDSPISYYGNSNAMFHHRFMGALIASIYSANTWGQWFLHRTPVGRALFRFIWSGMQSMLLGKANYDRADGKDNGFANLKPDSELFWQSDSSGVNQRADLFDILATKVKIYRQDIDRIGPYDVYLANGTSIETDAIIYATGWKDTTPYIEPHLAYSLGLATDPSGADHAEAEKWHVLEKSADATVLRQFPLLATPPPMYKPSRKETPFRLYKAILPIHDHSIAFVGKMMLANHTWNAEIQALSAVAALDGRIDLPSSSEMKKDVALVRAWQERRYPAKGSSGAWFFFDVVPYGDALLEQLGLSSHRSSGWADLFRPMEAKQLKGLIREFKEKAGVRQMKKVV